MLLEVSFQLLYLLDNSFSHNKYIGFMSIYDMVFEKGTEEANLVAKYHSDITNILKTVEFNLK